MSFVVRVLFVLLVLVAAVIFQCYRNLSAPVEAPKLDIHQYWGPGSGANYKENKAIEPFDIATNPAIIENLKLQLSNSVKLHEPLEGVGFEYGFNSKHLETVIKYWKNDYLPKWSEREAFLKKFPHFKTEIQGLKLHFIHVKPKKTDGKKVLPLLILHGWPGSVREFYDIIPLLTTPNSKSDYVFEVIAPSLVGYGWSQAASKIHFGPIEMSVVMRNLMLRLGHEKFFVQGGDWGSLIGSNLATLFPQNVIGYHSNMCNNIGPMGHMKSLLQSFFPSIFVEKEHTEFHKPLSKIFMIFMEEMGYMHIQATKPDTIGTALSNNPIGLVAYIIEKFSTWTNNDYKHLADGGLTKYFTMDALLDNVMIYFVTNSITTSQRLYSEAFTKSQFAFNIDKVPVTVPTGCARFKHEIMHVSDFVLKDKFVNLVHSTYHKDGGHFAAMQLPQIMYADFIQFVNKAII